MDDQSRVQAVEHPRKVGWVPALRKVRALEHLSPVIAALAVAVGVIVLLGWVFKLEVLKSFFPGLTAMKANTALGFLLAGISLWSATTLAVDAPFRAVARVCALVVLLLGLLSLGEYVTGRNFGIDELLIRDRTRLPGDIPGRMAVNTAVSFIALGLALVLANRNTGSLRRITTALALAPLLIGGVALVGYAYDLEGFFRVRLNYTPMALNTALVFMLLGVGVVNARADGTFHRLMTDDSAAGVSARRLLPAAIGLPLLTGWLVLQGHQTGVFTAAAGTALFAVANVGGLSAVILWNAHVLEGIDAQKKQAEQEIRRLNADLERRVVERTAQLDATVRELEGFSYSISHDLRTPLRAIDGFSRILLEDYHDRLDEEGRRLLNVIRNNTIRMAQLIDGILHFSRVGRLDLTPTDVDMGALTRDVLEELQPMLEGRNIDFEIGILPQARGDHHMLRQMLLNLLANAIKYTRPKEFAVIEVGSMPAPGETVYYVRDNGAGFDMRYADKLFGVFQRLHGMEEFEGVGIGLAIVKRVIARHGGRVWAEGRLNEGATFYFALPPVSESHES